MLIQRPLPNYVREDSVHDRNRDRALIMFSDTSLEGAAQFVERTLEDRGLEIEFDPSPHLDVWKWNFTNEQLPSGEIPGVFLRQARFHGELIPGTWILWLFTTLSQYDGIVWKKKIEGYFFDCAA